MKSLMSSDKRDQNERRSGDERIMIRTCSRVDARNPCYNPATHKHTVALPCVTGGDLVNENGNVRIDVSPRMNAARHDDLEERWR